VFLFLVLKSVINMKSVLSYLLIFYFKYRKHFFFLTNIVMWAILVLVYIYCYNNFPIECILESGGAGGDSSDS
jgi:hypothetical protein